jgi:hypothetical protein
VGVYVRRCAGKGVRVGMYGSGIGAKGEVDQQQGRMPVRPDSA